VKLKIFQNQEDTIALITLCNLENPSDGPSYLRITYTILNPGGKDSEKDSSRNFLEIVAKSKNA
jgi:hypothetical protein